MRIEGQKQPIPVTFLFDSGSTPSVMSVKGIGAKCAHGGIIKGVGGQQKVGKPLKCSFQLYCNDKTKYQHTIKPTSIAGENSLVILGLDFMSKFGYTVFDWKNHRISLGGHWGLLPFPQI